MVPRTGTSLTYSMPTVPPPRDPPKYPKMPPATRPTPPRKMASGRLNQAASNAPSRPRQSRVAPVTSQDTNVG
jgi:hypothetical protein